MKTKALITGTILLSGLAHAIDPVGEIEPMPTGLNFNFFPGKTVHEAPVKSNPLSTYVADLRFTGKKVNPDNIRNMPKGGYVTAPNVPDLNRYDADFNASSAKNAFDNLSSTGTDPLRTSWIDNRAGKPDTYISVVFPELRTIAGVTLCYKYKNPYNDMTSLQRPITTVVSSTIDDGASWSEVVTYSLENPIIMTSLGRDRNGSCDTINLDKNIKADGLKFDLSGRTGGYGNTYAIYLAEVYISTEDPVYPRE